MEGTEAGSLNVSQLGPTLDSEVHPHYMTMQSGNRTHLRNQVEDNQESQGKRFCTLRFAGGRVFPFTAAVKLIHVFV